MDKVVKYFSKHVGYNSLVHVVAGVGFGVLLTNSYFNPHPMRYGLFFLAVALLGYLYAYTKKK